MADKRAMKILLFLSISTLVSTVFAQLDEINDKALKDTQEVLLDSSKRQEAIHKDEGAKKADDGLNAVARDQADKDAIYNISSQVMKSITEQAKGDDVEMQKIMMEAQKDPKAFYEKFMSAEQKNQVRGLASEIEKSKAPQAAPQK